MHVEDVAVLVEARGAGRHRVFGADLHELLPLGDALRRVLGAVVGIFG